MLKLTSIVKKYLSGDSEVEALKGIDMSFRANEFVAILGPSGCGKTTLLNIIGGLDRYTSGDLSVNGVSTKDFKDSDWDTYRNLRVGFVFQSYNLIPHQSVLSNVELALTLSGVGKSERKQRAIAALDKVGLSDQIKKKPNQLSGGQMQRVAIARALVNDPEILLADEPTGALDSETSIQVMEILKEIAKEKLVIMVTHNPELAEKYATRTIRLLDGEVKDDTSPFDSNDEKIEKENEKKKKAPKKPSMSFFTAISLSLNNLMTKKARTFLTSFAGSIGIIGIALILAISTGINDYINTVQEDTLSSYPISIEHETIDMTSLMNSMSNNANNKTSHDLDKIYANTIMYDMMNTMMSEVQVNNLSEFKKFIESDSEMSQYASEFKYSYDIDLNIYKADTSESITQVNPSKIFENLYGQELAETMNGSSSIYSYVYSDMNVWNEMLGDKELLNSQYDVIAGNWPANYNEVVLIVDQNNEISDTVMYSLGLKDPAELKDIMTAAMKGETYEYKGEESYTYDDILNMNFKLVLPSDYYHYDEVTGKWDDMTQDKDHMKSIVNNGVEIKIVGIIRPNEDAIATSMTGAVGYTSDLTKYVIDETNKAEIVKQQLANPDIDIFTGIDFSKNSDTLDENFTMDDVNKYLSELDPDTQAQMQAYMQAMSEDEIVAMFKAQAQAQITTNTYEDNIKTLGIADLEAPSRINIYAKTFGDKDKVTEIIENYNQKMKDEDKEECIITYTDYMGILMSSVSTIINVISYVLIAFVSISLVVSSIMIGIITYISVLERTKEIGVLRSVGASKHDISRVFNAETAIVGFVAGLIGIGTTLLLSIPINIIIEALTDISGIAKLPVTGSVILVTISILLTLIAGLIPSKLAAKKDPVVALRSE